MPWELVRAGAPTTGGHRNQPTITFRRNQIAFNAIFIRANALDRMGRVSLYQDVELRRVGFTFHNNDDDKDSLALISDGGRNTKVTGGRIAQTSAFFRQPWLDSLLKNRSNTKFLPYKEQGRWVVDIGPTFEVEVESPSDVPAEVTGVYRYLDDGEVTYIGRGRIRQRMQDTQRREWRFDCVQFTPLNNPDEEMRWEQILLTEFEGKHGRLPRENRVRGYQPPTSE